MNPLPEESEDFNTTPLKKLLAVVESARKRGIRNDITDRDEWVIQIILSVLADPNHPAGKRICKDLFNKWLERGGEPPKFWEKRIIASLPKPPPPKPVYIWMKPEPPPKKEPYVHPPSKVQRLKHDAMGFAFALKHLRDCGVSGDDLKHAFMMTHHEYLSFVNRKFNDTDQVFSESYAEAPLLK